VGDRCTFHENRIDLAAPVAVGSDVGLSPEVVVYTHGYWMSPLEGFPMRRAGVTVGDGTIVGFRSVLLPGAEVPPLSVVGAGTVWPAGGFHENRRACVWGGNPARLIHGVYSPDRDHQQRIVREVLHAYERSRTYRGLPTYPVRGEGPRYTFKNFSFYFDPPMADGAASEDEDTDDLRWFLFQRGLRIYTKRRFRKLGMRP